MAQKIQVMIRLSARQIEYLETVAAESLNKDKGAGEPVYRADGTTNTSATIRRALYRAFPKLEELA